MQRVVVLGCPGSGKSTLARALGEKTGLPVVHSDKLFWNSGWVASTKDEIDRKLTVAAAEENWIIDGNYLRTLPQRLERCDTILFLDLPRWVCMYSIFKRFFTNLGKVRPDMPEGCPEALDWEFICWVWNFKKTHIGRMHQMVRRHPEKNVHIFKTRRQAKKFIEQNLWQGE